MTTPRSAEEKKALLKQLLAKRGGAKPEAAPAAAAQSGPSEGDFDNYTYDMFLTGSGPNMVEADRFGDWVGAAVKQAEYAFEAPRLGPQRSATSLRREDGAELEVLNFSSYNYLGFGTEEVVVEAAKDALDKYGLGAASSPAVSGRMDLHVKLEESLAEAYNRGGQDFGCTLFSSGYGVNLGVIPAVVKQDGYVILDAEAHMSLVEGAKLAGGRLRFFRHNDVEHLRSILKEVCDGKTRVLVCIEGVYSASGDIGDVKAIAEVCREHGALSLVDEAHSSMLMGPNGLGAADADGAMDLVDFIVLTFSKSFGGVGGALLAKRKLIPYFNWFSRTRFFSCALDPAVTGGLIKVVELGFSEEGERRRVRLQENSDRMREKLAGQVPISDSKTWLLPVIFGADELTLKVYDWLQRNGLDTSVMAFPATPKGQARARLFITSEHTPEQIDRAAALLCKAGDTFGFRQPDSKGAARPPIEVPAGPPIEVRPVVASKPAAAAASDAPKPAAAAADPKASAPATAPGRITFRPSTYRTVTTWRDMGEAVRLCGRDIFVIDTGETDRPAIFLIHGFPTSSWDWQPIWEALHEHHRLVCLDLLGFGFSDKPEPHHYSIHEQADICEAAVAHAGLDRFHVIAHDYGDTVAQELLARQNEGKGVGQWASLFLLNGGLFPEAHQPRPIQKALLGPAGFAISKLTPKLVFERNMRRVFGPHTPPSQELLDEYWRLLHYGGTRSPLHSLIHYMNDRRDNRERWVGALRNTTIPVGLVNGSLDPVSGAHMVARYREVVRSDDFIVELSRVGHFPQVEDPAAVVSAYADFRG